MIAHLRVEQRQAELVHRVDQHVRVLGRPATTKVFRGSAELGFIAVAPEVQVVGHNSLFGG